MPPFGGRMVSGVLRVAGRVRSCGLVTFLLMFTGGFYLSERSGD